jgi:hypothetical protein
MKITEMFKSSNKKLSKEEFKEKLKTDSQFREKYGNNSINQIDNIINTLKTNPDSRRIMLNAWNPEFIPKMTLDPCHYGFQIITREMNVIERTYEFNKYVSANSLEITGMGVEDAMNHYNFATRKISLKWNQRLLN